MDRHDDYSVGRWVKVPPNGEAQPPADGDGGVERYDAQHATAFHKAIQPVGWSAMLAAQR